MLQESQRQLICQSEFTFVVLGNGETLCFSGVTATTAIRTLERPKMRVHAGCVSVAHLVWWTGSLEQP